MVKSKSKQLILCPFERILLCTDHVDIKKHALVHIVISHLSLLQWGIFEIQKFQKLCYVNLFLRCNMQLKNRSRMLDVGVIKLVSMYSSSESLFCTLHMFSARPVSDRRWLYILIVDLALGTCRAWTELRWADVRLSIYSCWIFTIADSKYGSWKLPAFGTNLCFTSENSCAATIKDYGHATELNCTWLVLKLLCYDANFQNTTQNLVHFYIFGWR